VAIKLYRIDDRLIHGQVVLGWGQPLRLGFIVLVDDSVAHTAWEQELYRMGVPQGMEVFFETVDSFVQRVPGYQGRRDSGIVLTGDVATMERIVASVPGIAAVNVGGIHHRAGRLARLRYVFLSPEEERVLRAIAARGVRVTAQDLPSSTAVPLEEMVVESHT
jgi:PTS system mannose-specific IIB component/fructoselysine and glucoselysine-specific PTS system IIB component